MKNRKTQILIITILFLLLIAGLGFFNYKYPNVFTPEVFITLIAVFITIYFSLNKYWLDHDKIFIDLFHQMNDKFDELNEDLNSIIENGNTISKRSKEGVIQDYLNLCSEEYLWFKKGRIDPSVWKAWRAGMDYYLESDIIRNHFRDQQKENISYYGFFDVFKKL